MRHLTPLEANDRTHLITTGEELTSLVNTRFEIVNIDAAGKLHLLHLYDLLLLACFFFFFVTLKAVFTVIHRTAYGRNSVRSDQYEIVTAVVRICLSIVQAHNTELTVVFIQHTYFFDSDIIVDDKFFRANS